MKKITLALSAFALVLGPALAWSADEPSAAQPAAPATTSNAPSMGTPQAAAQTPPLNWTNLKGTVQSVNPDAKTVQLKDDSTGNVIQVPVDKQVSIQKDGKQIKLSQVQTGDIITLAKRNTSPEEQQKQQAY